MIKGAIFDMDGTLLDSMGVWNSLGAQSLLDRGIEPEPNLEDKLKTFTLEESAEYCRKRYNIDIPAEEIIGTIKKNLLTAYSETILLKDNVKIFLEKLKNRGVKMCVATVTDSRLAEVALRRLGIRDYFTQIFNCDENAMGKREPDIYRKALAHLGTSKGETVVFEDTIHALTTAKNDGFITAAVYDRHEKKQDEMKITADYYISDYSDFDFSKFD